MTNDSVETCQCRIENHPNLPHECHYDPRNYNIYWCETHLCMGGCPNGLIERDQK